MSFFKKLITIAVACVILLFNGSSLMQAQDSNNEQPNRVYLPLVSDNTGATVEQTMARRELCHGLVGRQLIDCLKMSGLWNKLLEMDEFAADFEDRNLGVIPTNSYKDTGESQYFDFTAGGTPLINIADLHSNLPIERLDAALITEDGLVELPPDLTGEDGWQIEVTNNENGWVYLWATRQGQTSNNDTLLLLVMDSNQYGTDPALVIPISSMQFGGATVNNNSIEVEILGTNTSPLKHPMTVNTFDVNDNLLVRTDVSLGTDQSATIILPNVVESPWQTGWIRKLRLQDSDGKVIAAQTYKLSLECHQSICSYVIYPISDVSPGVVTIRHELDLAIEYIKANFAEEVGNGMLLDLLVHYYPDLEGDVIVYGNEMGGPPSPECNCKWVHPFGNYYLPQTQKSNFAQPHSFTTRYGDYGPGASHWIGTRYQGKKSGDNKKRDIESTKIEGKTEIQLKLHCTQLVAQEPRKVVTPGGIIEIPGGWRQIPCRAPCQAEFHHRGEYLSDLQAKVKRGWFGSTAESKAQDEVLYTVDDEPIFNRIEFVGKETHVCYTASLAIPGLFSASVSCKNVKISAPGKDFSANFSWEENGQNGDKNAHINSAGEMMKFGVETRATMESVGQTYSLGRQNTYAEANIFNDYMMTVYGIASCTDIPEAANWAYKSTRGNTPGLVADIQTFFNQWGISVQP